ncbi:hypothetical protein Tel_14765 [Candidatus Tenderia electrophaga]|jgi:general secretion pathway protein H|uniref:Type II secretion system protein H n=1 Tax=Candidatus Tenderia electrophaga TaxID=1748243 RepID=A0A0S2TGN1_9GAMM|nr:hypothetical protein Tel_14765 [Candidatus Tenderia electrophaga]
MSSGRRQCDAQRGFTILELLVVLLIIGIVVSLATLSVGGNETRVLRDEAQRLSALLELAAQDAILNARELALEVDEEAYRFVQYNVEDETWQTLADDVFRPRELPPGIELNAVVEGQQPEAGKFGETEATRIFILSSGEMTPFTLTLKRVDGPSYELAGDMLGGLILEGPRES